MDSMIERVARAIFERHFADYSEPRPIWATIPYRDKWRALARAAIAAMREPTEAMIAAGVEVQCDHGESQCGAAYSWQEMIDSALKEGE